MNLIEHSLAALAIQAAIGIATRNWWAGAAAASCYFLGREIAQAEYRWIEQFGSGLRENMPWWAVFEARAWPKLDQIADWLGPILTTTAAAVFVSYRSSRSRALATRTGTSN